MKKKQSTSALIAAAGNSTRMGGNNKQFLVFEGMPVLVHTLLTFSTIQEINEIVVVAKNEDLQTVQNLIEEFSIPKIKIVVPGGATRQESVFRGLHHISNDRVLIHDGARPFVTTEEILQLLDALNHHSAATLGVPVKDTVKRATKDGLVSETLPRDELWQIQTPQGFVTSEILAAHEEAVARGVSVTDDCALAEYIGIPIKLVLGSYRNIKITTPEDIPLAEAFCWKY